MHDDAHWWVMYIIGKERERKESHNAIKQTFAGNLLSSFSLFNNANNRFTSPQQPCIVLQFFNGIVWQLSNLREILDKSRQHPAREFLSPPGRTHAQTDRQLENLLPPAPGICRIGRGHISHIGNESVPKITINDTISLFFKLLSAFC